MNRQLATTFAILPLVGGLIHYNSYMVHRRQQLQRQVFKTRQPVRQDPGESAKLYATRLILQDLARSAHPAFEPRLLTSAVSWPSGRWPGPHPTGTWRVTGMISYQTRDHPPLPAILSFQADLHWDPVRGGWLPTRVSSQSRTGRPAPSRGSRP